MNKESLLRKERWKRSLSDGNITLLAESVYTLAQTTEKREPIYNNKGVLVDTRAFKLVDGKLISPTATSAEQGDSDDK